MTSYTYLLKEAEIEKIKEFYKDFIFESKNLIFILQIFFLLYAFTISSASSFIAQRLSSLSADFIVTDFSAT